MTYKLPKLPYEFNALEPYIDTRTMTVHYRMHHQGYVDKLNKALEGYEDLQKKSVYDLLYELDSVPQEIRTAVRNNGGGHWNHTFFWRCMARDGGGAPRGDIAAAIDSAFGSFDDFRDKFIAAGTSQFGSGYAWLIAAKGELEIIATANAVPPLALESDALLGCDVWEHAYYIDYRNARPKYLEEIWKLINWDFVAANYAG